MFTSGLFGAIPNLYLPVLCAVEVLSTASTIVADINSQRRTMHLLEQIMMDGPAQGPTKRIKH